MIAATHPAAQVSPDTDIALPAGLRLRCRHGAAVFLAALTAAALLSGRCAALLPLAWSGAYVGWLYLRFFQALPGNKAAGDPSEDFRCEGSWRCDAECCVR